MSASIAELRPRRGRRSTSHTISLYVRDEPGVLVRVAMVFSRRGYNIESLVVSPAAQPGYSRMTITCSGDETILVQMIKQLDKLVDVVSAVDHTHDEAYETEIALVKLRWSDDDRSEILQIPNGVDTDRFRPPRGEERARARERFGLPGGAFVIEARTQS